MHSAFRMPAEKCSELRTRMIVKSALLYAPSHAQAGIDPIQNTRSQLPDSPPAPPAILASAAALPEVIGELETVSP